MHARDASVDRGGGKTGWNRRKGIETKGEGHGGGTCDEYIKNKKVGTKGGEMAANEGE